MMKPFVCNQMEFKNLFKNQLTNKLFTYNSYT